MYYEILIIKMKLSLLVFVVLSLVLAVIAVDTQAPCHPQCKWQCDDPACPAVCHPICARPKCQMQCEELPCPKCDVHCEKPACSVRCPKSLCEKDDCPKCETVCSPPVCHTAVLLQSQSVLHFVKLLTVTGSAVSH